MSNIIRGADGRCKVQQYKCLQTVVVDCNGGLVLLPWCGDGNKGGGRYVLNWGAKYLKNPGQFIFILYIPIRAMAQVQYRWEVSLELSLGGCIG